MRRRAPVTLAGPCLTRDPTTGIVVAADNDDRPPPERYRHDVIGVTDIVVDGRARQVRRVLTEAAIDRYHRRGEISEPQYRAALRLRSVFVIGGLAPRLTARYEAATARRLRPVDSEDRGVLDARTRCRAALAAVGPVLAPILLHVVCLDGAASDWAAGRGRVGKRAGTEGLVTLSLALEALAIHYGFVAGAKSGLD